MNPRLLIHIDNLFHLPYWLWIYLLPKREHPVGVNMDKDVMVIKMMGIGSITRIHNQLTNADVGFGKVKFVTFKTNKELCDVLQITNVYYVDNTKWSSAILGFVKLFWYIRNNTFQSVVNFERSSNFLGLFLLLSTCFSSKKTISFHDFKRDISSRNDHIFKVQDRPFVELIALSLPSIPKADSKKTTSVQVGINSSVILINVNASDYMIHRRYPPEKFVKLIEGLSQWNDQLVFKLVGSKNEFDYVNSLIRRLDDHEVRIENCCGAWSLNELLDGFRTSALFITNDSGPMHLAATTNIPMIVLWGPTSPNHFGYDKKHIINVYSQRACSPCFTYAKSKSAASACCGNIDCMKGILDEQLLNTTITLLESGSSSRIEESLAHKEAKIIDFIPA